MNCSRSRKILSAYLDGEIRPEDRIETDAHLASCPECSNLLMELTDITALFQASGRFRAPYGLSTRVLAAARGAGSGKAGWVRRIVFIAEGFAVAMVVLAGIMTGSIVSRSASPSAGPGIASQLSLEMFDAAPPGSPGAAYLAMAGVNGEE